MALGSDAAASRAADSGAAGDGAPGSPQAPEELVEIQLRALLESTQTSAGAVCLFDQHQELLRLAVEVGLSDEGCRRLRSVRRGAATTWDMPLHSLLNRRVYLIESAAKNRYVPPLVDDVAQVRAVACIPLYDGSTPVGSLILVALAPRSFGERQIRLLEQPVRELVSQIIAMRKRVSTAVPQRANRPSLASAGAVAHAGVAVAGPTMPGVKTAPGSTAAPSAIQAAVDRARAELERLRARLSEADEVAATERARAESLAQPLQEAQARSSELQAERDRLTETLATRTHDAHVLEDRVASLEAELAEARASEAALHAQLEQVRETSAAGVAAASQESAALDALRARLGELETANERLRQLVTELEAAETTARADAQQKVATATADVEARLTSTASEIEHRLGVVTAERDALGAELSAARAAHEQARGDAETRHASARGDLEARLAAAEQGAAEWQRRCESVEAELATTRAAVGSQSEQAEAVARERAHWEAERDSAREREDALAQRVARLVAELESTRHEDTQLRDGFAHLESLIQTGVEDGSAPTNRRVVDLSDASSFEVVELDDTSPAPDDAASSGLEIDALVLEEVAGAPEAATPTAAVASAPAPETAPPEGLLVLDTETFWTQAAAAGASITVVAPDSAATARLQPAQVLLNLAAPNSLAAFAALRSAGITAPCVACIGVAGHPRAVVVGRFELAARPIDPDALLATARGRFARGTRVVTAGADVDGLISLRQALARLGVSVSMAWDAKQAADLLAMVHPEVAIIDLELPPKGGCALVARMGLVQPTPFVIVVPKATDTASAFATAAAHPEIARMSMPAKEILARAIVLTSSTPPAARR